MKRILLLCFVHGFKGTDNSFRSFPDHLKSAVQSDLPEDKVESVIYPQYETKGELAASTEAFLEWLKERVMERRKAHLDTTWPPSERSVGVILIAHSMGGFVASDALFCILNDRHTHPPSSPSDPIFPLIQGILCFDTPLNGLARSMFVYGAFSNYQKVSNVFNVMTALSAAAPASLSRLAITRKTAAASVSRAAATPRSNPAAWKTWQLVAVRTGTVGAIAAGGVAAYMHRRQIYEGVQNFSIRATGESVAQGYRGGVDALGQGLAYVNRGAVGKSFAWLSDHLTFVGALLKQTEMQRRLERLAALKGVGVRDVYTSLGENGVWSGGYFIPERTFCAVPGKDQPGGGLFERWVVEDVDDEVVAHMSLFKPEQNKEYERMTSEAAKLVMGWFRAEEEVLDDPRSAQQVPEEKSEAEVVAEAVEGSGDGADILDKITADADNEKNQVDDETQLPDADLDESPLDIAAAALLVPLPEGADGELQEGEDGPEKPSDQKHAYMRHLFGIAQQTGTNIRSYIPTKLPTVDRAYITKVSMPSVNMSGLPSMPNVLPKVNLFSRKPGASAEEPMAKKSAQEAGEVKDGDEVQGTVEGHAEITNAKEDSTEGKTVTEIGVAVTQ